MHDAELWKFVVVIVCGMLMTFKFLWSSVPNFFNLGQLRILGGNHPFLINLMIGGKGLDQHNIRMFGYLLSVLGRGGERREEGGGRSLLTYMFVLPTETNENGL